MKNLDFKKALVPLLVLGVILLIYIAWRFFGLPPEDRLIEIARHYFDKYGLGILLVSAIIEGTVLVGWYYPGSLIIFLGVILAGPGMPQVVAAVSTIALGLFFAFLINFLLGKYGWYRLLMKFGLKDALDEAKIKVEKYGLSAIFMSYWQPNLGALVATSAGILKFSFGKFFILSAIATALWSAFWGALVYFVGEGVLDLVGLRFVLLIVFVWVVYRMWRREDKHDIMKNVID